MKTTTFQPATAVRRAAYGFVAFSIFSLLSVSLMAIVNPQAVMDLVAVRLPNTDAFSSIRGVYGGVGLTICGHLLGILRRQQLRAALRFLLALWGFYALARLTTIGVEGPLGAFGTRWLLIETTLCIAAGLLLTLLRREVVAADV